MDACFQVPAFSKLNSPGLSQVGDYFLSPSFQTMRSDKVSRCCGEHTWLARGEGAKGTLMKAHWVFKCLLFICKLPISQKWKLKPLSSYSIALKCHQQTLGRNQRCFRNGGWSFEHVLHFCVAIWNSVDRRGFSSSERTGMTELFTGWSSTEFGNSNPPQVTATPVLIRFGVEGHKAVK